jgi:uncharacterized protein YhaN
MRIRGAAVQCFAPLDGWTFGDLPAGLVVFYGRNEAGKTVLARLLTAILCGFAPGRWERVSGRALGGRLWLECGGGEHVVERWLAGGGEPRVTGPDGRVGGAQDLARLLGDANGEQVRTPCMIGQADIDARALLGDDDLGKAILNPALARLRQTAERAFGAIDAESAELLSGHGRGRIELAVAELNRLRPRLDAARRSAAGYDELRAAVERAGEDLERCRARVRERRAERERLARRIDARPLGRGMEEDRTGLARLETAAEPSPGTVSQGPEIAIELAELRSRRRALEEERERATLARDALRSSLSDVLERWGPERTLREAGAAGPVHEPGPTALGASSSMAGVSPGAGAVPIAAVAVEFRDAEIRGWERRLAAARGEEHAAENALALAVRQRDELRRQIRAMERHLPAAPPVEPETLARERGALARIRAALAARESDRTVAEALGRQIAEGERMLRLLQSEGDPDLPPWLVIAILVAILGSVFVLLAVGGAEDSWTIVIVVVMAVLAALNGIVELRQWVARRKRARKKLIQGLRAELQRAQRSRDGNPGETEPWHAAVAEECAALALPAEPTAESVAAREAELTAREVEGAQWNVARPHIEELERSLAEIEHRIRLLTEDLSSARRRRGTATGEWSAWRAEAGFASELTPEQVRALLAYGDGAAGDGAPHLAAMQATSGDGGASTNGVALAEKLVGSLRDDLAAECSRREEAIAAREEEIRALRRREEEIERRLGIGGGESWRELLAASPVDLAESLRSLDGEIEQAEAAVERALLDAESARLACLALESSTELAALEVEWGAWMTELARAVDRWRRLAAARGLLDESMRSLERTGEPPALVAASRSLAVATRGRYARIAQDGSGRGLDLVDHDGRRKRVPEDLSRSTAEQVALCLRLAVACEREGGVEPLPLLLDEVFSGFDPDRARGMAEVLRELASVRQVLYFTCHPDVRDLLCELAGAARVVEL